MAATFGGNGAQTSTKYFTEEVVGVLKWSENHKFL